MAQKKSYIPHFIKALFSRLHRATSLSLRKIFLFIVISSALTTARAQTPLPNPDLVQSCPYDIIFVLDESGSIVGSSRGTSNISPQVRSGAGDLISALNGTGSRVAVVEFNSTARLAQIGGLTTYQTINNAYVTAFNNYISQDNNSNPNSSSYDPEDCNQCYTNWEAAFNQVEFINANLGLADLVIFFTDGMPTAYINPSGLVTQGTDAATSAQALIESINAANAVKMQGSHIFVVGIPNPNLPESNVQAISDPDKYPVPQADFIQGDYTVSSSATLQHDLSGIAYAVCVVDLRLEKTASVPTVCAGEQAVFTLTLFNEGEDAGTGIIVRDVIPNGYNYLSNNGGTSITETGGIVTWDVGTLDAGAWVSIQITVTINPTGNYRNIAQVVACPQTDSDSSPNNDDGDQSEDDEAFAIVSVNNCDDGNGCTDDECHNGVCLHVPVACSDDDDCTIDQCVNGICIFASIDCYDGNSCTTDGCEHGTCVHATVSFQRTDSVTICSNEFYFAGGQLRNTNGTYIDTFSSAAGCDSIIRTILSVIPIARKFLRVPICQGDSIYAGGYYRKTSGVYYDTLNAANGCDSILTTAVVIPNCSDNNVCTDDFCDNGMCAHQPAACDDGDLCTTDGCQLICIHTPINCDDGFFCTSDFCSNGSCQHITSFITVTIVEEGGFCLGSALMLRAVASQADSYEWSTGETSATISATAAEEYHVTVTDVNGCAGQDSHTASTSFDLNFSSYALLAQKKATLNLNTFFSGGIGIISPSGIAIFDSTLLTAPTTFLKADSIQLTGTSAVTIQLPDAAAINLPPFEANPFSTGANLNIPSASTVTLTDSVYGVITVGKFSTVTFASPMVNIKSLITREKVSLHFAPCSRMRVSNKINLGELNNINPGGNEVKIYCVYGMKIGTGSQVTANIFIQNGNLTIDAAVPAKPNIMAGTFIANEVFSEAYTYWHKNRGCVDSCRTRDFSFKQMGQKIIGDNFDLKAYPNPFGKVLTIEFSVEEGSKALLEIFDISGRKLATLFEGKTEVSGIYKVDFIPNQAGNKIFIYRLQTGKDVQVGKAVMN